MYVYFHMKHVAFIIIILKNCIILIQDIVKIDTVKDCPRLTLRYEPFKKFIL